jgi:hypothetical protein
MQASLALLRNPSTRYLATSSTLRVPVVTPAASTPSATPGNSARSATPVSSGVPVTQTVSTRSATPVSSGAPVTQTVSARSATPVSSGAPVTQTVSTRSATPVSSGVPVTQAASMPSGTPGNSARSGGPARSTQRQADRQARVHHALSVRARNARAGSCRPRGRRLPSGDAAPSRQGAAPSRQRTTCATRRRSRPAARSHRCRLRPSSPGPHTPPGRLGTRVRGTAARPVWTASQPGRITTPSPSSAPTREAKTEPPAEP